MMRSFLISIKRRHNFFTLLRDLTIVAFLIAKASFSMRIIIIEAVLNIQENIYLFRSYERMSSYVLRGSQVKHYVINSNFYA